jgi:cytochrome P450
MRYGPEWRLHRTFLHRKLHPTACEIYIPAQERHTRHLLRRIMLDGANPFAQIKRAVGALIMEVCVLYSSIRVFSV